ncbi:TPA_asm: L polymerase [finepatterned puffer bornavirus]|uniref:RNA-directed RNA polymerase n=1 Tax=finepatterned puffer bornavirus TaxID=3055758 RepID=A0AA48SKA7_9MONO|nr:TPA_asm: L polymerase [finepatterned puffer bornavirus]
MATVTYRTDQSLKSALLGTEIALFKEDPLYYHSRMPSLLPRVYKSNEYYKFFLDNFTPSVNRPKNLGATAQNLWKVVATTWCCDQAVTEKVRKRIPEILHNTQFKEILEKHLCLQDCIQAVSFSDKESITHYLGNIRACFLRSLVLCSVNDVCCVMTYNHFLSVADIYRTRVHLYLAALVEDLMCKWPLSSLEMVYKLVTLVDSAARVTEHDLYFSGVKCMYSRAQSKVRFYHNADIQDSTDLVTREAVGPLGPDLEKMMDDLAKTHPTYCLELFSVQKAFFFPEINLAEGVAQQFTRMRKENTDSSGLEEAGNEILWVFRGEYIRGYIRKHSKWPVVTLSPSANSILRASRDRGEWPRDGTWRYDMFKHVELGYQNVPLEFDPDLNDIITDKAIIEDRTRWTYEYNMEAYKKKHGTRLNRTSEDPGHKRLIKAALAGDLDHLEDTLKGYSSGEIDANDLVTVLVPKEKELKVKGRYFSKQSLKTRVYQVLSELNLKKHIMEYFRTHTMTTSATQLSHILDKVSMQITSKNAFVINLDFESWCNTFRPELQQPICEELDRMFGSGAFFQVGSWIPLATTFLVQDRHNSPKQDENGLPTEDGSTCMVGGLTMGEGMRQKLWTLMTGCVELLVLQKLGFSGEVLGSGDNQTLVVKCPRHMEKDVCYKKIINELEKQALRAGMVLKPDECWASDVLYEYGKKMYFKGAPVSNYLKIFSRISDSTGEVYPNIYSRLSCLSSSCLSAAQADYSSWPSLISSIMVYVIELRILLPRKIHEDLDLMTCIGLVGPTIGGLPSPATLPSVMYRGLPDPLSFQLKLLSVAVDLGVSKATLHQVAKIIVPTAKNPLALCVDPTCLNLLPLRRPEMVLRSWIEESLSEQVGSGRLLRVMQLGVSEKSRVLAEDLATMEPKFPRLMSYIFGLSNAAYGMTMLDKFQKSSTIICMSQTINMCNIIEESRMFKLQVVESILRPNREGINILSYLGGCTHDQAQRLRTDTWGYELKGVSAPFIAEQFSVRTEASEEDVRNSILFVLKEDLSIRDITNRGRHPLYIGSRTFMKVNRGAITGLPEGRIGKMAESLVAVYDWIKLRGTCETGSLKELLDVLLHEKGVEMPDIPVVSGGTLTHRLPTSGDDRSGLAGSLNTISTHMCFTTDYMSNYAKSQEDYTLHFQGAFLHAFNVLASKLHGGFLPAGTYYLTINCSSCTKTIGEEAFKLTRPPMYVGINLSDLVKESESERNDWDGDPFVISAHKLGIEVYRSFSLESRGMHSVLDSGLSPTHLERLSLSHLRGLPLLVIIAGIWWGSMQDRKRVQSVGAHLIRSVHSHGGSPTLRWFTKCVYGSDDLEQFTSLVTKLGVRPLYWVSGCSPREGVVSQVLIEGLGLCNQVSRRIVSSQKTSDMHLASESAPPLDSLLGVVKSMYGVSKTSETDCFTTNTFEHHGHDTCCDHTPLMSLTAYPTSLLAQLLKGLIAKENVEILVVSKNTPTQVVLDLCHVTQVVMVTGGDPTQLEAVLSTDMCGCAKKNLMVEMSLSTLECARWYYHHGSDPPPGAYYHKSNDEIEVGLCGCSELNGLYKDGVHIDLSDMCCSPRVSKRCPSLFFEEERLVGDLVMSIHGLLGAIERFESSTQCRYGETDIQRSDSVRLNSMVSQLHLHLELLRMATGHRVRPRCRYYIRSIGTFLEVHRRPPGTMYTCHSGPLPYCPRVFGTADFSSVAYLL